ncbi:MAG: hypothetical protein ETSY1_23270 [Candidatus Entotheonella factor]|uniref:Uncharacterized protein n=1 Tax=Entotheonella factor TaxID=1429438 RepID=W4LHC5_ENTF1|nr:hypothetical protein [Candidatus Entotheonella palauensis]ETW97294.1 MAG: hypothetical protein ETSY1_23270 [Candidatus Entotheonella factor]
MANAAVASESSERLQGLVEANMFELDSGKIQVSYSSTSFAGVPLLTYRDRKQQQTFQDNEIHIENTSIGQLVSVTLEHIPDLRIVTFSLILPAVYVMPASIGVPVKVPGVTTTTFQNFGGPRQGQERIYSTAKFRGTAQFAVF